MEKYINSMQNINNYILEKIEENKKELETTTNNERKRIIGEKVRLLYMIKFFIEKEVITKIFENKINNEILKK